MKAVMDKAHDMGHVLLSCVFDGCAFVFCKHCGARTSSIVKYLGKKCNGAPCTPGMAYNLQSLLAGRGPFGKGSARRCKVIGTSRAHIDTVGAKVLQGLAASRRRITGKTADPIWIQSNSYPDDMVVDLDLKQRAFSRLRRRDKTFDEDWRGPRAPGRPATASDRLAVLAARVRAKHGT